MELRLALILFDAVISGAVALLIATGQQIVLNEALQTCGLFLTLSAV